MLSNHGTLSTLDLCASLIYTANYTLVHEDASCSLQVSVKIQDKEFITIYKSDIGSRADERPDGQRYTFGTVRMMRDSVRAALHLI